MRGGRSAGVALMEIVVSLMLAAVLTLFLAPSVRGLLASSQMTSVTNELATHLNVARYEAIKRGVPVAVCVSANGLSCSGSTRWDQGWMVFVDDDGVAGQFDGRDHLVAVMTPPSGDHVLVGDSSRIRYGPLGSIID